MLFQLTPRTWLAIVALGPAIYIAIQLIPLLRSIFLLLVVAALLALLINPVADRLEHRGISRALTTGALLIGTLALLVGLLLLLVPVLLDSLGQLAGALQGLAAQLPDAVDAATGWEELVQVVQGLTGQVAGAIQWAAGQFWGVLGGIGTVAFAGVVAFAIAFTLVANKAAAPTLMRTLLPERTHARVVEITRAVGEGLSRWFVAQLAICGYYAVTYSVTNTLLGVPYGLQIGIVSGLLEFIPYLGGIVGMALSALSAATVSPTLALIVLVTNVVIGSICVYFVAPYAFSKAVEVPAALILFGLFIGGLVGGFLAALLTVPLITSCLVIYRQLRSRPATAPIVGAPRPRPAGD